MVEQQVNRGLVKQLVDGTIDPQDVTQLLKLERKDRDRFWKYLEVLQERVPWDETILMRLADKIYIVRDAAGWIGKGVATLVNLLVPDIVILGGGLVESMPDLFLEEVGRTADDTVMRGYRGSYTLCTAELGDDAAVMGAAAWA